MSIYKLAYFTDSNHYLATNIDVCCFHMQDDDYQSAVNGLIRCVSIYLLIIVIIY